MGALQGGWDKSKKGFLCLGVRKPLPGKVLQSLPDTALLRLAAILPDRGEVSLHELETRPPVHVVLFRLDSGLLEARERALR